MTLLTVSVALGTCNGARYLGAQMRSICEQDPPPREIVLSDDASDDDSVAVARAACASAAPSSGIDLVTLHNPRRLGITGNFEQAARACRHELIALSDQDDLWRPGRLRRMVQAFKTRPDLLLLHTDARLVDAQGAPLGDSLFDALEVTHGELKRIHAGTAFDALLRRNLVTGATTVFRRSLLEAALPFPAEWLHDEWLGIIAAALGCVDVIEQPLIDYRQHGGNQIGQRHHSLADKIRKALASRGTTPIRRVHKAQLLLERLELLPGRVKPETIEKARAKLEHQRFRTALPLSRWARCAPVLRQTLTGHYHRFGYGLGDVARDLLQAP